MASQFPDDPELLARAGRGDADALSTLYARHGGRVYALVLRMLRSRPEAEDVLQETFVEIWRRARDYTAARGTVEAWTLTIARTRAIDRMRSLGAQLRLRDSADRLGALAREPPRTPDVSGGDAEDSARVRRALDALPPEQRGPLQLAYFEGLSQREIAERTGDPLGTVKTRIRLGMQKLSALLEP